MEILAQGRLSRGAWLAAAIVALLPLTGCELLETNEECSTKPPPPSKVCQIVATWQNHVEFSPDPTKNGQQGPVLAGRLYLFGQEIGFPVMGDGTISVALYDESTEKSEMQEVWTVDKVTLASLVRQDRIGWGYTLLLPMSKYRPDMSRVRMKVCYHGPNGSRIYTEGLVTLAGENGVVHVTKTSTPIVAPEKKN
jgi:hypothetical protein